VALLELGFGFVGEPVGEGAVDIVPTVVVTGLDVKRSASVPSAPSVRVGAWVMPPSVDGARTEAV
jgi:hypothetical protein